MISLREWGSEEPDYSENPEYKEWMGEGRVAYEIINNSPHVTLLISPEKTFITEDEIDDCLNFIDTKWEELSLEYDVADDIGLDFVATENIQDGDITVSTKVLFKLYTEEEMGNM